MEPLRLQHHALTGSEEIEEKIESAPKPFGFNWFRELGRR
jgi:hypothetical protein